MYIHSETRIVRRVLNSGRADATAEYVLAVVTWGCLGFEKPVSFKPAVLRFPWIDLNKSGLALLEKECPDAAKRMQVQLNDALCKPVISESDLEQNNAEFKKYMEELESEVEEHHNETSTPG